MNSINSEAQVRVLGSSAQLLHALHNSVAAGFPSPAEDMGGQRVDLTRELVEHPQATFLLRARGISMTGAGILDGDILVVDRALSARSGSIVVAVVDGEFTVKTLQRQAPACGCALRTRLITTSSPPKGRRWKSGGWSRRPSIVSSAERCTEAAACTP